MHPRAKLMVDSGWQSLTVGADRDIRKRSMGSREGFVLSGKTNSRFVVEVEQ
jgi:hypothetical protein